MSRRFQLVDVFGAEPMRGNPLAVVLDAEDITTDEMQQITRWLNYSETTFLLPPTSEDADYRVRIFTLDREMPFAGHPTLGSCHAWLAAGGTPRRGDEIVQECGAGLVRIRTGDRLAFAAPPIIRGGPVDAAELAEVAEVLQIEPSAVVDAQWVDNGPGWVAVLLGSAEAVLAVEPKRSHPRRADVGVVGPYPDGSAAAFELRAIFSDDRRNLVEDPVTGSLNASVAQWLYASGRVTGPYVASQGARVGRAGEIHVERDDTGTVWVGGRTTTIVDGALTGGRWS